MTRTSTQTKGPLAATVNDVGLDADALRDRCAAVLAEAPYWFPVRHHSPAVARHLETVIQARRPKVIFLEGPSEANDLIPHVVDAKTKPPVAIYSSYRDDENVLGLAGIESPAPTMRPDSTSMTTPPSARRSRQPSTMSVVEQAVA